MSETEKYIEWKNFVRDEELAADLALIEGNEKEISTAFLRALTSALPDFGGFWERARTV